MTEAERLIRGYYAAFNTGDRRAMCAMLTADVIHDVNQGGRRQGIEAFRDFLARMDGSYTERVEDLVVMTDPTGTHAAANTSAPMRACPKRAASATPCPPARSSKSARRASPASPPTTTCAPGSRR